jgi:glycosyltransferase involved in cell wall biosynthesis
VHFQSSIAARKKSCRTKSITMTTFVREPIWPMRCFNHSSHPEESVPMIETLSTQSRELLESSQVIPGPRYWAGDSRTTLPAGIVFQANLQDGTENAEENWHLALGLAQNQIPLRLVPLDPIEEAQPLLPESVREGLKHLALQRVDLASSVIYQAGAPTSWNLDFYGRCRIGRAAFGTDRIPDGWAERCNAIDEIWVPSDFNRETLASSGVETQKIRVLHTGVDARHFRPGLPPRDIPHKRGFNFLSTTDLRRQCGTDVLLRAYLQEFTPDDDVALLLRISSHKGSSTDPQAELTFFIETELKTRIERTPTIILLDAPLSHADAARLYTSTNAYVLPSRGEAWGRGCLEALAAGLPVIATNWGTVSEFLTDGNSFPIAVEGIVPASCEDELVAGHRWAEPSVDHLRQRMREVFSNSSDVQTRAAQGRREVVEHWDWAVVMPEWVQEFRRLCE